MQSDGRRVPLLLSALACFAGAEIGYVSSVTVVTGLHLPILWLPIGLIAGGLAVAPTAQWSRLLAVGCGAMVLSSLVHGGSAIPTVLLAGVYAGEAWLTAWLLRRMLADEFDLSRLTHIMTFFLVSVVGPVVGGVFGAAVVRFIMPSSASAEVTWLAWSVTDSLGILLGAPLVFGWRQYPDTITAPRRRRVLEAIAIMTAVMVTAVGVFRGDFPEVLRAPAFLLPLFFLAIFRFGPGGAALALIGVVGIALPNTASGRGPFIVPGVPVVTGILRAQLVAVMSAVSFLLLATTVAERRRIARERSNLIADLQQALLEIKTLRGFIPLCAWCHKVRDDAGFWQEIESYLHTHTDAVVSHGICPSCSERESREIESHAADHA